MKRAAFLLAGLLAFLPVLAAPDAMTDLAASAPAKAPQLHVTLTFTAPSGATSYDIRYSTSLITSANFSSASVAGTRTLTGSTITPGSVGTVQSTEILGLTPNTTYYFAMKSSDGVTPSAMSNVVTITTAKYQGYGYVVSGGGDGYICRVTTTSDNISTVGSMRNCIFSTGTFPKTIVFAVGGTITQMTDIILLINQSNLTIDGSTAPSPGITIGKQACTAAEQASTSCPSSANCLLRGQFLIGQQQSTKTTNIILTYLRFNGNYQRGWAVCSCDSCATLDAQYNWGNLVWDHLTVRNGSDGNPDLWTGVYQGENVTQSNTLIAWAYHTQLISGSHPDLGGYRDKLSLYRNVYARVGQRMPLMHAQTTNVDFRNNIIYDWSSSWVGVSGGDGTQIEPLATGASGAWLRPSANIINNYWKSGGNHPNLGLFYGSLPDNDSADGGAAGGVTGCPPQGSVYAGCSSAGLCAGATNMGAIRTFGNILPSQNCDQWSTQSTELTVPSGATVTTLSASSLFVSVLPDVGTHYRTQDEIDLLNEISPTTSATCGNGVREGSEVCDGTDFGTDSCVARGFIGGTLTCDVTCGIVTTPNCTTSAVRRSFMRGVTIKGGYLP